MKRFSKLLSIVLLGTSLMAVTPLEANAAWKKDNKGWWYTEGNSYVKNSWRKINGSWYYFDNSGYMKTGWLKDNGKWYYMDNSGAMQTGLIEENYKYYYLDNNGAMKTGWVEIDSEWYYAENSGAMKNGWLKYNGDWYCLAYNGRMEKDVWMYGGYHLNSQGIWDESTKYHLEDFMSDFMATCESGRIIVAAGDQGPTTLINNEPISYFDELEDYRNSYFVGLNTLNVYDIDGRIVDKVKLINK